MKGLTSMGAAVIVALAGGCTKAPPSAVAAADAGTKLAPRVGIRVPLPEGWTALVTADGSLRAGPSGKPLMRIDRQAGAGGDLPTPEGFQASFAAGLRSSTLRKVDVSRADGFVGLTATVVKVQADGGAQDTLIGLGARRAGSDLFLCATTPGTPAAETAAALKSCADIGTASADTP